MKKMKDSRLCFISRNYYNLTSAGNKAKADNEDTLTEMGAINLGLHRTVINSKIIAFFLDLLGIIRACILLKRRYSLLTVPHQKIFYFFMQNSKMEGGKDCITHPRHWFYPNSSSHSATGSKPSVQQRLHYCIQ